mmetsp:Transcript_21951/g.52246  ORF Transcript_21951/g.52246 Transcript_21951/m.52246 type:complete len:96 (-) Transcript_21951:2420-2707(-)
MYATYHSRRFQALYVADMSFSRVIFSNHVECSDWYSTVRSCNGIFPSSVQLLFLHTHLQKNCDEKAEAQKNCTTPEYIIPYVGIRLAIHADPDVA